VPPYPSIEPDARGRLDVGDGHLVYWETCGNPSGTPVLVVHGGPGSGCTPGARRALDPDRYRVVLFDQRNCGRSLPHASDPDVDLAINDTDHLIGDMEALREHLGIHRWLLRGASWGSVLSLAYARRHPDRVSGMVLMGVATGRRRETDLITRGLGRLFPEAWAAFLDPVPAAERDGDLADAYHRLVFDPDPSVRERAARRWCDWEEAIIPTAAGPNPRYDDPRFRLAFVRIVTHYWRHGSWLDGEDLIEGFTGLADIPGVVVQGVLDLGNLLGTAWELTHAWPGSRLVMVDDAGHEGGAALSEAVMAATDELVSRTAAPHSSGPAAIPVATANRPVP
jgi:proline iminopeptidase